MEIKVIKVGELVDFVNDPSFTKLPNLPISPQRATSQQHNPRAKFDDPALIIAYNTVNEIIAYFGCLPGELKNGERLCWSSCWWSHPEKGNEAVMPVFYKALQLWNAKMLFDALPERSRTILEKMGYFSFRSISGSTFYFRSKLHKIIPGRYPSVAVFKSILYVLDIVLNIPARFVSRLKKSRFDLSSTIRFSKVDDIDSELAAFISRQSENDLIVRDQNVFNWIKKYSWLNQDTSLVTRYHFSSFAKTFENRLLKVEEGDRIITFLWLTYRDGTAKLPFCYVEPGKEHLAAKVLANQILSLKPEVFICYQQNILTEFRQLKPSLYSRKIEKHFGWTNTLDSNLLSNAYIQDGDGDGVFT